MLGRPRNTRKLIDRRTREALEIHRLGLHVQPAGVEL